MEPTDLIAHPEGGRYREVYRSASGVVAGARGSRSALTHIYFALEDGEVSRFHRVQSDEVWNLYRGAGVRLHLWSGDSSSIEVIELSAAAGAYCHVVPAGVWQAVTPIAGAVLVGCTVAPGFEFADFELMDVRSDAARRLVREHPELGALV